MKARCIYAFLFLTAVACARTLVVGISDVCSETDNGTPANRAPSFYSVALEKGGHASVLIPKTTDPDKLAEIVSRIDVLLLTGGEDVDPDRYGEAKSPKCGRPNLVRDEYEWALLTAAKARRLPILGICRGTQMLNVFFGGTLYQDLPSEFEPSEGKARVHVEGAFPWKYEYSRTNPPMHTVSAVVGSRLAEIVGADRPIWVNSHHHQAVKKLAPGFRVAAYAPDGVIEGIESDAYPAAGVQFHPESLVAVSEEPRYELSRLLAIFQRLTRIVGVE